MPETTGQRIVRECRGLSPYTFGAFWEHIAERIDVAIAEALKEPSREWLHMDAARTMLIEERGELQAKLAEAQKDAERYRAALLRNRQGYVNILEMRKLSSEQWGQRDGYGGRYGALTREEIEEVIFQIDQALAIDAARANAEVPK